jgi:hypothetical protein
MNKGVSGWLGAALLVWGASGQGAESSWTSALVREALASGFESTLPLHAAMVLGVAADGEKVAVRQLVERSEHQVRTFNVSIKRHGDVVLFAVDESTQSTVAYLVSPGGKLRKAISYHSGEQPQQLSAEEARRDFLREVHYWSKRSRANAPTPAPLPAPAPAPAPPAAPAPH